MSPILDHFEHMFGNFEHMFGHLEPMFGHLEPMFEHLSTKMEPKWAKMTVLSPKKVDEGVKLFGSQGWGRSPGSPLDMIL